MLERHVQSSKVFQSPQKPQLLAWQGMCWIYHQIIPSAIPLMLYKHSHKPMVDGTYTYLGPDNEDVSYYSSPQKDRNMQKNHERPLNSGIFDLLSSGRVPKKGRMDDGILKFSDPAFPLANDHGNVFGSHTQEKRHAGIRQSRKSCRVLGTQQGRGVASPWWLMMPYDWDVSHL